MLGTFPDFDAQQTCVQRGGQIPMILAHSAAFCVCQLVIPTTSCDDGVIESQYSGSQPRRVWPAGVPVGSAGTLASGSLGQRSNLTVAYILIPPCPFTVSFGHTIKHGPLRLSCRSSDAGHDVDKQCEQVERDYFFRSND